jgi:hypothetical protein
MSEIVLLLFWIAAIITILSFAKINHSNHEFRKPRQMVPGRPTLAMAVSVGPSGWNDRLRLYGGFE